MNDSPEAPDSAGSAILALEAIMARLRDPAKGCPWDLAQTFATIAPYTIEEAYEVADAIDRDDLADLREELGDLLFQVIFHSRMAQEAGAFTLADVVRGICDKMVRRHPHVFDTADGRNAATQSDAWERTKAAERARKSGTGAGPPSALDGVALALPALLRAEKLQQRAASSGFDWTDPNDIFEKLAEETTEVRNAIASGEPEAVEDEIGDLLFVAANLARRLNVDPEAALRRANAKFERRFREMETLARSEGTEFTRLSLAEQETLWQRVKRSEKG